MLFLPVSEQSVDELSAAKDLNRVRAFVGELLVAEIAALLMIQKIGMMPRPAAGNTVGYHARIEKSLSAFIVVLNDYSESERIDEFSDHYDPSLFQAGRKHLEEEDVILMSATEIAEEQYLDHNGEWVWSYDKKRRSHLTPNAILQKHQTKERTLTDEQHRVVNTINVDPDQSLDISGYAGSGKTRLIASLPGIIPTDTTYYLTLHEDQRASMARRLPTGTRTSTFSEIARSILQARGVLGTDAQTMQRIAHPFEPNPERLIVELGVHAVGEATPMDVVRCISQTVVRYCDSPHPGIRTAHIPRRYGLFSLAEKQIVTALAKKLWTLTTGPDAEDWLPLRDYHLIKMLALSKLPIPETTTHLVIDEAHDLPKSVIEIIDRGSQAVITLGDRYQALSYHRTATKQRGHGVNTREMVYSVRAGNNIAGTINNICAFHPVQYSYEFEGSREKRTRIVQYSEFQIPDASCAILSKSGFYLFSIMQRLAVRGARFHVLRGPDLLHLMSDAVNLFYKRTRASHRDLVQYATWDAFMDAEHNPVTEKIDHLFRRGYGMANLRDAMAKAEPGYGPGIYVIGRIDDARNKEFSRVALLSDVLRSEGRTKAEIGHFINCIYTGFSRARDEIILPEDLEGRIADSIGT